MESIHHHIEKYLEEFISNPAPLFETLYAKLQNQSKLEFKKVLKYLYNVIHETSGEIENDLKGLHLHFEEDFNDNIKSLIAEFIILQQFYSANENKTKINTESPYITSKKELLNAKSKKLATCPDGASGNKQNKIFKSWQNEIAKTKQLLAFYHSLDYDTCLLPRTLVNCQVKIENSLNNCFAANPFAIAIENLTAENTSLAVLNSRSFNDISKSKIGDSYLLRILETIILFDCENSVKRFSEFNLQRLADLNKNHKTKFKNLAIVTFGKDENCLDDLKTKIQLIRERFKIPVGKSYTFLSMEINMLLNKEINGSVPVNFVGINNSSYWDTFLLETKIRGIYELRSVKMLNLYSLVFNEDIKNYLLDELFSKRETSKFISPSTKQSILELGDEDHHLLKGALSDLLNLFISSDLKDQILEKIIDGIQIIATDLLLKDEKFRAKICLALGLKYDSQLKTWKDLKNLREKPVLILEYRDQGNSKNYYFPNVIESKFINNNQVSSIFIKCLFSHQFEWAKYNFLREYQKYLENPLRESSFSWKNLKAKIELTKPQQQISINWNLEDEYSDSENRETIKIKFKHPRKSKVYPSSDLFIIKNESRSEYRVKKINDLLNFVEGDDILFVQNLDEIQESINIYEKIVDTKQQEEELKAIRENFDFRDEEPGRLWKVLLKSNSVKKGENNFYEELKNYLEKKGCSIVSFFHFKNSWINPKSESLAPLNKKVFIAICDYLNIPRSYFVIMQRIRNASKQATRQSTRQMNYLLKDLFNDGCFDDIKKCKEIINDRLIIYKKNHPLDELGINESNLLSNLVALVELIHPELSLMEVEKIEKIEQ